MENLFRINVNHGISPVSSEGTGCPLCLASSARRGFGNLSNFSEQEIEMIAEYDVFLEIALNKAIRF